MNEFFAMGGYAWFVWPAYAITFAVVFLNIWLALRSLRLAKRDAQRRLTVQGSAP